jgi:hypothetical protein
VHGERHREQGEDGGVHCERMGAGVRVDAGSERGVVEHRQRHRHRQQSAGDSRQSDTHTHVSEFYPLLQQMMQRAKRCMRLGVKDPLSINIMVPKTHKNYTKRKTLCFSLLQLRIVRTPSPPLGGNSVFTPAKKAVFTPIEL